VLRAQAPPSPAPALLPLQLACGHTYRLLIARHGRSVLVRPEEESASQDQSTRCDMQSARLPGTVMNCRVKALSSRLSKLRKLRQYNSHQGVIVLGQRVDR